MTGIVTDTEGVADLLHQHGALSFWDFAACAPYVDIEMYGPGTSVKDAIFISPHKFIGGPGTPGVLVVRRELMTNRVPVVPGGGTVMYVNPTEHRYLDDPAHREEGGTPGIVESIRAGLVFQLKQAVGVETIQAHEEEMLSRAVEAWVAEPTIQILGNLDSQRLSIVSFVLKAPDGSYLHHNYVVALLNDLFGIQTRGGCSCAGPYGHRLLDIDLDTSHQFEAQIAGGCEGIKPGWVRVNFNYFVEEEVFTYVVEAVRLVAREGWRLLGDYSLRPGDGPVAPPHRHRRAAAAPGRRHLRRGRHHDVAPAHDDGPRLGAQGAPRRGPVDPGRRDPTGLVGHRPPDRGLRRPQVVRAARLLTCVRARPTRPGPAAPAAIHGIGSSQRYSSGSTTLPSTRAQISSRPAKATPMTSWVMLTGCQPDGFSGASSGPIIGSS